MPNGSSILIVGAGDLGLRIALRCAAATGIHRVWLAGRNPARGHIDARLIDACSVGAMVAFRHVDALDEEDMSALLCELQPDALIQCASMHSPWLLRESSGPATDALLRAGFASELSAQLPIAASVLSAAHRIGFDGPIVNCSYPDVVNAVLHRIGIAPTFGIGNAGMIHMLARSALRARGDHRKLHTLAHHAHVTMTATSRFPVDTNMSTPRFFLDGEEHAPTSVFANACAIATDRRLNEITAAHAVSMIQSYLGLAPELSTSAPGVFGMPGGWPVAVSRGAIDLDFPSGITRQDVLNFNQEAARMDGVADIDDDGTVHFTDRLCAELQPRWPQLAAPLAPRDGMLRYRTLHAAMRSGAM